MKIGFDAKRLYNNFTGLGNYSRFVVSALHESYPDDELFLFTPKVKQNADTTPFIAQPHFNTILPPSWMSTLKLGSVWRSFFVGGAAAKAGVEIYHGLSHELPADLPASIKKVVTIHDLIFLRYPQFYKPIDVKIYKTKVVKACSIADRIIAISEQTANDIVSFLGVSRDQIDVVYQGCHPNFRKKFSAHEITTIKAKYNLPANYILNVGTIEERKNAGLIVKALAELPADRKIPVVIIGKKTAYYDELEALAKSLGVRDNVTFIHNADFRDLPAIYQGASVFVYPSLFEGFGIPLVEAIESGIPVITSYDSCFSEAAGEHSIYINPSNYQELASQIEKVAGDDALRADMVAGSKKYIERFQPAVVAKAMHTVYESLF